jgi:rubrerythrin
MKPAHYFTSKEAISFFTDAHQEGEFICPKCRVEMGVGWIDHVAVEYCPQCNGIFLDGGELEALRRNKGP